jgi:hypothetical protein
MSMQDSKKIADLLKIPGQKTVPLVIGGIGTESAIPYMRSLLRLNTTATKDQVSPIGQKQFCKKKTEMNLST